LTNTEVGHYRLSSVGIGPFDTLTVLSNVEGLRPIPGTAKFIRIWEPVPGTALNPFGCIPAACRGFVIPANAGIQEKKDWMPDQVRHDEMRPIPRSLLRGSSLELNGLLSFADALFISPVDRIRELRYIDKNCDTERCLIYGFELENTPGKEKLIQKAAAKEGKTKSAYILEAVEEKLGIVKDEK